MSSKKDRKGYELAPANFIMLDDTRLEENEKALNVKVLVCDHTGEDLVDIISKACQEEK